MNYISSSSDSDIIDDTGCEDKFQSTYWDINYLHMIENDDELEMEDEEKEQEEEEPHARAINRIQYSKVNTSGELVREDYYIPNEEEEYADSESDEEDDDSSDDPVSIELDPKLCLKMKALGLQTDMDELYDPFMDDKDEQWAQNYFRKENDQKNDKMEVEDTQPETPRKHRRTDASLCCPNCFTTVCTECRLVRSGPLAKVKKTYDHDNSDVFIAKTVLNCLTVKTQSAAGTIQEGEDAKKVNMGYIVICKICGNEVGFWNGKEYLLMNLIEEDGGLI